MNNIDLFVFIFFIIIVGIIGLIGGFLFAKNDKKPNYNITKIVEPPINQNYDTIRNYDIGKLVDPLVNPDRRPNRYELPNIEFQKTIDIATQGYPDSYILMGLLISKSNCKNKNCTKNHGDKKILKLFGRQEYPGSNKYEYYALEDNFGNYIKFPINIRQNEIYDGDFINVIGFDNTFQVTLYKYDLPRYYPHIL